MVVAHPGNDWNPGHISIMTSLGADGNRRPLDHAVMQHRTTIAGKTPDRAVAVMPEPLTAY